MSLLADIVLLCEGEDSGPDVRLLEVGRQFIATHGLDKAAWVSIQPAGSKTEISSRIRIQRQLSSGARVFAIRDRDFLPADVRATNCARARLREPQPFVLSRHSIESYLLDPEFVLAALGLETATLTEDLARTRYWEDVAQAALRDVEYDVRQVRAKIRQPLPIDRESAVTAVRDTLTIMQEHLQSAVSERAAQLVDKFADDMRMDGPVWQRVHGRRLLAQIEDSLRKQGVLPGGGLANELLRYAERSLDPPPALADELRGFLAAVL